MKAIRRVLIFGSMGSGKSTLAKRLGAVLNLPVIHLDSHFWRPNWVEPDRETWRAQQRELVQASEWIMDGNYSATLDERWPYADTIIFVDQPRLLCLWRVVKRRVMYHGRSRPDLAPDCPEKLDSVAFDFVWNYPKARRPKVLKRLAEAKATKLVFHLRGDAAIEQFLVDLSQIAA
ncbi:MAG: AAA family ATPase [Chloroflexi bacterium]|nr:AAA family ATPase [Chloroflexota bacterium]